MTDLLLNRYHSLDYIMTLNFEEALSLINFAFKQREEEFIFQRWINGIQFQISFDEFKERLKPKPIKSDEQILLEVKEILTLFER